MHMTALDQSFSLFGMFLVTIGMAGGKRIKIWKVEVGPIQQGWRVVSILLGLLVLTGIGAMVYLQELNSL